MCIAPVSRLRRAMACVILETYYSLAAFSWAQISLDYQRIEDPCYNTDRGPVSVTAVRVHAQF
jgi:high affinity Mn2+ porin